MALLASNAYGQEFCNAYGEKETFNYGLPCDPSQPINAGGTIR